MGKCPQMLDLFLLANVGVTENRGVWGGLDKVFHRGAFLLRPASRQNPHFCRKVRGKNGAPGGGWCRRNAASAVHSPRFCSPCLGCSSCGRSPSGYSGRRFLALSRRVPQLHRARNDKGLVRVALKATPPRPNSLPSLRHFYFAIFPVSPFNSMTMPSIAASPTFSGR